MDDERRYTRARRLGQVYARDVRRVMRGARLCRVPTCKLVIVARIDRVRPAYQEAGSIGLSLLCVLRSACTLQQDGSLLRVLGRKEGNGWQAARF